MDTFTPVSATAPIARAIAALTAARKFPLRVDCLGEIEHPEDDPIYGSYTVPHTVELAQCASLAEAIACVERLARQDEIAAGEDGALGFLPRLFIVRDDEQCLVLAGEPWQRGVRWCEPVASDGEARLVVEKASKLRGEASFEAGWDNQQHRPQPSLPRERSRGPAGRCLLAPGGHAALLQAA